MNSNINCAKRTRDRSEADIEVGATCNRRYRQRIKIRISFHTVNMTKLSI